MTRIYFSWNVLGMYSAQKEKGCSVRAFVLEIFASEDVLEALGRPKRLWITR